MTRMLSKSIDIQMGMQILGLSLSLASYFLLYYYFDFEYFAAATASVTILCAIWWSTEAIPIPITSLIPFIVFPILGILDYDELSGAFGNKYILLFMGGFMISRAAEKSQAHLRVAHGMVKIVGTNSNKKLIIGFMLAAAFCSMWISNTATALIMLPVALAVISESKNDRNFAISLLLAIAYGASIGGIATIIGTPPNGVFAATYERATSFPVDFISWLQIGLPTSLLMLVACGAVLTFLVKGKNSYIPEDLGEWTPAQRRVLFILAITAVLWITRRLPFGLGGWSAWLQTPLANDATVALLSTVVLFLTPNGTLTKEGKRDHLLDWNTASHIPWGILLLFAGGLAIAKAFATSGLAVTIGQQLEEVTQGQPLLATITTLCFSVTFLTEVTSNTATTTLLMPILAASATAAEVDPALYMIPAAMSASCAFMLPVATPPNAIVFGGSDLITIPVMVRYGLILNLIGVAIISIICYLVLDPEKGLALTPPEELIQAIEQR